jgi:hypothetical protein
MIENEKIAAEVSESLRKVYRMLEDSIWRVNEHCSAGEATEYRQRVGKIFYTIVFDLLEPLYNQHPTLKPEGWTDN